MHFGIDIGLHACYNMITFCNKTGKSSKEVCSMKEEKKAKTMPKPELEVIRYQPIDVISCS